MIKKIKITILLLTIVINANSQQKIKYFSGGQKIYHIDTATIIPQSVHIQADEKLPNYTINYKKNLLIFQDTVKKNFQIKYKTLQKNIFKPVCIYDTTVIVPELKKGKNDISYQPNQYQLIENQSIETEGSINRYISIGNNQGVVIGSNLNLKLSGKSEDGMQIDAYITDNQLPINPDGTTTNLLDLTKIYIKVYDSTHYYSAGDLKFQNSTNKFIKFNKEVKGLKVSIKDSSYQVKSGLSITKGKYYKQEFYGQEGNQGPYKLIGANAEQFLIIVAGSERVYVDGKLKKRGLENDYTIDYNRAELSFSPRCPINSKSRIVIEFQYTQKFYPQFFNYAEIQGKEKKIHYQIGFYTKYDAKNQAFTALTQSQKNYLYQLGDSTKNVFYPSYKIDSTAKIRYKKIDTTVNGITYHNVLVYHPQNKGNYTATFVYVGKGNGNYNLLENGINGTIYQWSAPQNGKPTGEYQAAIILQAPTNQKILSIITQYQNKNDILTTQTAIENYDKNTFSPYDDKDNNSLAQYIQYKHKINNWQFTTSYQLTTKNITLFEPFRPVEFTRDWNLLNQQQNNIQNLFSLQIKNQKDTANYTQLNINWLNIPQKYNGLKTDLYTNKQNKFFNNKNKISLLQTSENQRKTKFIRTNTQLSAVYKNIQLGLLYQNEINLIYKQQQIDSLSFAYHSFGVFLRSKDTTKINTNLIIYKRFDYQANNKLFLTDISDNLTFNLQKKSGRYLKTKFNINYRKIKNNDTIKTTINGQQHITFHYKGLLINGLYSQMRGKIPQQKFVFVEVEPTKGQYQWIDYNNDGIEQINEFEPAKYPDQAKYIKIPLQTNKYIPVYIYQITQQLSINPHLFINKYNWLKNIKNTISININKQQKDIQPFSKQTVAKNLYFTNQLQITPTENITFLWKSTKNEQTQTLLISDEKTKQIKNELLLTYKIKTKAISQLKLSISQNSRASNFFTENNYQYQSFSIANQTAINFQQKITSINYSYTKKQTPDSTIKLNQHKINLNTQIYLKNFQINFSIDYIKNNINTMENNPLTYNLLEGLHPGNNYLIEVKISKTILQNLQFSLTYNGRIEQQIPVHTATFNITGFF